MWGTKGFGGVQGGCEVLGGGCRQGDVGTRWEGAAGVGLGVRCLSSLWGGGASVVAGSRALPSQWCWGWGAASRAGPPPWAPAGQGDGGRTWHLGEGEPPAAPLTLRPPWDGASGRAAPQAHSPRPGQGQRSVGGATAGAGGGPSCPLACQAGDEGTAGERGIPGGVQHSQDTYEAQRGGECRARDPWLRQAEAGR